VIERFNALWVHIEQFPDIAPNVKAQVMPMRQDSARSYDHVRYQAQCI
jgi:hypothetical protein